MKMLNLIGTVLEHVPFVGQFLPKDKPWYTSLTAQVGSIWGVAEIVLPILPSFFPATAAFCVSAQAAIRVAGPILMILGVRKTVIDTANGVPTAPATPPAAPPK